MNWMVGEMNPWMTLCSGNMDCIGKDKERRTGWPGMPWMFLSICALLLSGTTICTAQVPFKQGVNVTEWFQASSVRQIQFSKFTRADFEQIKGLGCDVVRLPINLHAMTSGAPDYTIDPLFFVFMDQVADWCSDLDLNLILDNHTFDPGAATPSDIAIPLNAVWAQMAEHYKNRPLNIYYEVLNEPHGITAQAWGKIQQDVINTIRAVDTEHYIIVGGVNYNSYNDLATLPVYTDSKLIYTFHFYDPFLFTHQGASWVSPSLEPLSGIPFPYGASPMPTLAAALRGTWVEGSFNNYAQDGTVARVKQLIDVAATFSASRKVPVYCGEFGVFMRNSNNQQRVAWYKVVRDHLTEKNIPWTMWDYRGGFGLFEKGTDELFDSDVNVPLVQALSLKAPAQMSPVQPVVKDTFGIYHDYLARGITDVSGNTSGILDYYDDESHDGAYAIHLANVEQYFAIALDFRPNLDMSYLPANGNTLEFWVKGDTPGSSFDVRFIDTKTDAGDHPWRMGMTIDEIIAPWDNAWHHVSIPLSSLQEKGSYDNGWYPAEGKFNWHAVDRFEIVAEAQSLAGVSFRFDEVRVGGDAVGDEVVTAITEQSPNIPFDVFPNPTTGILRVKSLEPGEHMTASLLNAAGATIYYGDREQTGNEFYFDVSGLPAGLYLLRINASNATYTRKVILK